jgi:hypothetical protein
MKKIPIYQADAFTDHPFSGNPAAVCPLEEWLPDQTMQLIAMENNLAKPHLSYRMKVLIIFVGSHHPSKLIFVAMQHLLLLLCILNYSNIPVKRYVSFQKADG